MTKSLLTVLFLASLLALSGSPSADDNDDDDDGDEFVATLRGSQEVPPVTTQTRGKVEIEFNEDETEAEFELTVFDGLRVTQAHFHCAPSGSNGNIVAFLAGFHSLGWNVDGEWIDHTTLTDQNIIPTATPSATCPDTIRTLHDLANSMRRGNIYANVHTVAHGAGEVRGQVRRKR